MKDYKLLDRVGYTAIDFDGKITADAVITEVGEGYALAVEITAKRPLRFYIDDFNDYMFTIL